MPRTCSQALIVVLVALGCSRDVPGVELSRDDPSRQTVGGVQFVELFERGANDTSPLLVGLHGRGDTAERFASAWHNFPAKLEIALALPPLPYAGGRKWFDWPPGMTDDALATALCDAVRGVLRELITEVHRAAEAQSRAALVGAILAPSTQITHDNKRPPLPHLCI